MMKRAREMKRRCLQVSMAVVSWVCVQGAVAGGYLVSSNGEVVRDSSGNCVHTSFWNPAEAVIGCDGKVAAEPVAVVVAEPVPPPVEAVVPMALETETLFAFDKATLDAEARSRLDRVIREIRDVPGVERITITGHTDPIGTDSYNQALSERRAASVRDYLVERIGSRDRIFTSGEGESEIIVRCPDKSGNALIRCLAPNRRANVHIELKVAE